MNTKKPKTIGVIAEFNPFHTGHRHLFEEIRRKTNAEYIVVAMSGDFVQRGSVAMMDKYTRAKSALLHGADVVLELPVLYACASAEYFATAGVMVLKAAGVDAICFGAEDPAFPFEEIAKLISEESDKFRDALNTALKQGLSYPEAREQAILAGLLESGTSSDLADALRQPNNILGIEYAKAALDAGISIIPIKRDGNDYHETQLYDSQNDSSHPSASAIRSAIKAGEDLAFKDSVYECIETYQEKEQKLFLFDDDLSDMLYHALMLHSANGYTAFFDCDEALSNRIVNMLPQYEGFSQFVDLLATKNNTHAKVSRVLLHILLDIRTDAFSDANGIGSRVKIAAPGYLRLLGFKKDSSAVLSVMKENQILPVIAKPANAKDVLDSSALLCFEKDLQASDLYHYLSSQEKRADISISPVIL